MGPVFKKLNLKDHAEVVVLDAPESFEDEVATLEGRRVVRDLSEAREATFVIAFVTNQDDVDRHAVAVTERAAGDAVVWFAYPKGSSKRYRSEINRDRGWERLGAAGFEPVRQVAVDEDWSALRFRRVEHIDKLTRDPQRALSEAGKRRRGS
jgi:hypothetical protein